MTEKRIASIAALIAATGILLFGIASLIHPLRSPQFAMPRGRSVSYASAGPLAATPLGHAQSFTNQFSSRSSTNKLWPADISAILNSLKATETNLFAHSNDLAGAFANAFATNEQFKALGLNPEVVSNAVMKAFSRPGVLQQFLTNPIVEEEIKRSIEDAPLKELKEQTRIIGAHP